MIRSTAILAMGAVLILLLAACGSDTAVPQATSAPVPKATSSPVPKATAVPAPKATAVPAPKATATPEPSTLVVLTNDSFDIGEEIIAQFEEINNASVTIQKAGSSGQVLNRAILEKGNPSGDLLYGVDNTFLSRALREEIFIQYKSGQIGNIPAQFILDDTFHVSPVDYGYVNINYDIAYLDDKGLAPPASLEVLTQPEWDGRLVVENPATSTPGLAFLISTVSYFGEDDDYDYLDFWADLKKNNVAVKEGWSEAYYTDFTKYGGDRPLVVSYATSPAAELFFSEGAYEVPPTGNVLVDKATFLQIEGIGILKGTDNETLAKKFVDFVLDVPFQEYIPGRMFVYPVNSKAQTPDYFQYAEVPTAPSDIDAATIDAKRDDWIDAWTSVVIR